MTQAQRAARRAGSSTAARRTVLAGWAAHGVVYVALAYLVLQTALGSAEQQASTTGALQKIAQTAPGTATLVVLGVGLLAFAVGRLLEVTALAGPGIGPKDKAVAVVLALVQASLALTAFSIVGLAGSGSGGGSGGAGGGGSGGGSTEQQGSSLLFGLPGGRYLVGLVGLVVIGVGVHAVYKGARKRFLPTLRTHEMPSALRSAVRWLGTAAYVTKGAVLALVGWFFLQAALTYDPQEARGLDAALRAVAQQPLGRVVLVLVAAGLLAYALYALLTARYRDVGSAAGGTA